ncbi:MAG: tetratricopeptide repeat protein [Gammaproteobacteria bacterium]|nr:tetratricopeptide repeat protein [Gammaproteobacteria bacterium]
MHIRADFVELCSQLNFNRENVYAIDKKSKDAIPVAVSLIQNTILKHGDHRTECYAKLCKQLGIYFLFHAREHVTAQRYLTKYQELSVGETFDHAEACNLKGIANVIDSEYKTDLLFIVALNNYESLLRDDKNNGDYLIGKASALRHMSLVAQRNEKLEEAQSYLQDAMQTQKMYSETLAGKIDTAEALHIAALILIHQNKLSEAEKKLDEALSVWRTLSKKTDHAYPMMHITMQTYANVLRLLDRREEAKKMLHQIYISQVAHHKIETHADIANTLQLSGEVIEEMHKYDEAHLTYKQSLQIKLDLQYKENSAFLKVTQDSIARIQKKLKPAEKNSAPSFWKEKEKATPASSVTASEHASTPSLK